MSCAPWVRRSCRSCTRCATPSDPRRLRFLVAPASTKASYVPGVVDVANVSCSGAASSARAPSAPWKSGSRSSPPAGSRAARHATRRASRQLSGTGRAALHDAEDLEQLGSIVRHHRDPIAGSQPGRRQRGVQAVHVRPARRRSGCATFRPTRPCRGVRSRSLGRSRRSCRRWSARSRSCRRGHVGAGATSRNRLTETTIARSHQLLDRRVAAESRGHDQAIAHLRREPEHAERVPPRAHRVARMGEDAAVPSGPPARCIVISGPIADQRAPGPSSRRCRCRRRWRCHRGGSRRLRGAARPAAGS